MSSGSGDPGASRVTQLGCKLSSGGRVLSVFEHGEGEFAESMRAVKWLWGC